MPNQLGPNALPTRGAVALPVHRYMGEARYATLEYYNVGRTRTRTATLVLNLFASVASSVALTRGVDRTDLFESYDIKLWSYNDHVALFALATAPSVAILTGIYVAFRGVEILRSALSL